MSRQEVKQENNQNDERENLSAQTDSASQTDSPYSSPPQSKGSGLLRGIEGGSEKNRLRKSLKKEAQNAPKRHQLLKSTAEKLPRSSLADSSGLPRVMKKWNEHSAQQKKSLTKASNNPAASIEELQAAMQKNKSAKKTEDAIANEAKTEIVKSVMKTNPMVNMVTSIPGVDGCLDKIGCSDGCSPFVSKGMEIMLIILSLTLIL